MRLVGPALVLTLSALGCSSMLGYDEISFEDNDSGTGGAVSGGGQSAGGTPSGGASSGGASSGGSSSGGSSTGGTSSGGTSSGGASSGGTSSGGTSSGGSSGDPLETYRQKCVDQINQYRASLALPPYQRWTSAEPCVDNEAKTDSQANDPHSSFGSCGESAQNECPGYPSLDSTVTTCLAQMWAEGPGTDFQKHGHYINMSSTKYTKVACGFYVPPNGGVWAAQDFQ